MYIRFVVPARDEWSGVEVGIFRGVDETLFGLTRASDWLLDEVDREYAWFNRNMAVPKVLERNGGRHGYIHGVCWFSPEAGEAISRAHYLAWLLEEADIPVCELRSDHPGQIIWRDKMQVVAKPSRNHPRVFH
jgi:hypothetical protein